ncbi:MAG: class I SAM-dependent methyltransferase [Elusimicrobiota bacterium]
MNPADHERWNEGMARRYNPDAFITRSGFPIRWMEARRLRETRRALACRPTDAVLDVGCGAGNLLERLDAGRLAGLDLSDTLLEKARQRLSGRPEAQILKGDAETLPFPDAGFDRVVCSETLEHVRRPEAVLKEIHRVAKPGARVVITVPNERVINAAKRIVLALGLKKWVAGGYDMPDDMLSAWHLSEIESDWVMDACRPLFRLEKTVKAPFPLFPCHTLFVFVRPA